MVNIVIWSIWSSGHLIIWSLWSSFHLIIWSSGNLVNMLIWSFGQYGQYGHLVILSIWSMWSSGHLVQSVTNISEHSNIRIFWSQIFIRTFVRIKFSYTNIFGHSFVSNLFVQIYSAIRSLECKN